MDAHTPESDSAVAVPRVGMVAENDAATNGIHNKTPADVPSDQLSARARKRLKQQNYKARVAAKPKRTLEEIEQRRQQHESDRSNGVTAAWDPAKASNKDFEQYYQLQGICPPGEWQQFMHSLGQPLPTTFRLGTINAVYGRFQQRLQTDCYGTRDPVTHQPLSLTINGQPLTPPQPLPWYPNNLAWYVGVSKQDIRRVPQLQEFREFLIAETESGNLTRQEAVSMVPPLFLDVQSHHMVLDMCAAPGSKTGQLLEALHSDVEQQSVPTGMVIANDADAKRAYMLVHQLKRLGSPNFLVTTHDGQHYPTLYRRRRNPTQSAAQNGEPTVTSSLNGQHSLNSLMDGSSAATTANITRMSDLEPIQFDRILCDVPCSGDGTLRKTSSIWLKWSLRGGIGLHPLQLMIARRSAQLLKIGGRMVYSTCSFNPIEDEAVVAELIRRSNYTLQLVDCSDQLPGLKRMPGLQTWKVVDPQTKQPVEYTQQQSQRLKRSFFPPTAAEELQKLHLERCMRMLPHHQDTGGFFVAVLEKTGAMPTTTPATRQPPNGAASMQHQTDVTSAAQTADNGDEEVIQTAEDAADLAAADATTVSELAADEGGEQHGGAAAKPKPTYGNELHNQQNRKERPPGGYDIPKAEMLVPMSDDLAAEIIKFYGLPDTISTANFFTHHDTSKRCFFVAPAISEILLCPRNNRLKVVNSGSRCFEYNRTRNHEPYACQMRIAQEGVHYILPYMTKQVIDTPLDIFKQLVSYESVPLAPYVELANSTDADASVDPAHKRFGQQAAASIFGCVVCVFRGPEAQQLTGRSNGVVALTAWMTTKSITLMVTKEWRTSVASMLDIKVESTHRQQKDRRGEVVATSKPQGSSNGDDAAKPAQ